MERGVERRGGGGGGGGEYGYIELAAASPSSSLPPCQAQASQLGSSLASKDNQLSLAQSELGRLRDQLAAAEQRVGEREASSQRQQEKADGLLESLREEYGRSKSRLEER